jgi:hypothetical protein
MGIMFFIPRVAAILLAVFYALFAFDTPLGVGFLVHLIPSLIIIACVAAFWKYDLAACAAFLVLCLAVTLYYQTWTALSHFLLITVAYALVSLFYLISFLNRRQEDKER